MFFRKVNINRWPCIAKKGHYMIKNLSIVSRLMIIIGLLTIPLIANLIIAFGGLSLASDEIEKLYHGGAREVADLSAIKEIFNQSTLNIKSKVTEKVLSWEEGQELTRQGVSRMEKRWENFMKNYDYLEKTSKPYSLIPSVQQKMKEAELFLEKFQDVLRKQNQDEFAAFSVKELFPFHENFNSSLDQLISAYVDDTETDFQYTVNAISNYKMLMWIILIILWCAAAILALFVAFGISKSINTTVDTIKNLSMGDTAKDITVESDNEIGRLQAAMQAMVISARKMSETLSVIADGNLTLEFIPRSDRDALGNTIVTLTEKLKQIIGDLQTEVATLTTSAEEIVASVSQVSTGTAETAAAVNETTTTVEELKQTAHLSSEKANDVLSSAEETLKIVKTSEKSLQNTLEDMNHINDKMQVISEGIVKLSEHSHAIADIIDTVNDLAEQSNLLAVNAAIEAAKAGEQGKSFGVVAQEIRSLAEQSKAATIQVRSILNDIQNATSAAVLATEQGSKAVEKGVSQSSQTRESMHALSSSISHVAQAASQIALSSKQQLIGVDQVTVAMNNISEATTQHVEHMKQIEIAVNSLNNVGQNLKEITDQYILNIYDGNPKLKKQQPKIGKRVLVENKEKIMALS